MRPATPPVDTQPPKSGHWQAELARGFRTPADLLGALGLARTAAGLAAATSQSFPLRVPRGFVARMRHGDPRDPLLLQVLPAPEESLPAAGYVADPVGDLASIRTPGLLQKYAGRALLIATGACAVHCRYCFRREFPYSEHSAAANQLDLALTAIADDPSLIEIIVSGGDPLVLGEARFESLLLALDAIPHVERIRLHSRVPVVLPERIDSRFLGLLGRLRARIVVVIHANHAHEIDASVTAALDAIAAVSGPVLNQSVLLRGINDSADALVALSRALFAARVLPYYLHQLDPVTGTRHFAVPDAEALNLVAGVMQRLPGYLVPKLVREIPGNSSKSLLGPFGTT
jgi:EF-P beta-lysylation protein EpmB